MVFGRSEKALQKKLEAEFEQKYYVMVESVAQSLGWKPEKVLDIISDIDIAVLSNDNRVIYARKSLPYTIQDHLSTSGICALDELSERLSISQDILRDVIEQESELDISSGLVVKGSRLEVDLVKRLGLGEIINIPEYASSIGLNLENVQSLIKGLSIVVIEYDNKVRALKPFIESVLDFVYSKKHTTLDEIAENFEIPTATLRGILRHNIGQRIRWILESDDVLSPNFVYEIQKHAGEEGLVTNLCDEFSISSDVMKYILTQFIGAEVHDGTYKLKAKKSSKTTSIPKKKPEGLAILRLWSSMQYITTMMDISYTMFEAKEVDNFLDNVLSRSDVPLPLRVIMLKHQAERYSSMGALLSAMKIYAVIVSNFDFPPFLADFYHTMYVFHLRRGSQERVLRALESDLEHYPSGELLCFKAKVLLHNHDAMKALTLLQKAREMSPDYFDITDRLSKILFTMNRQKEAMTIVDEYISLKPKSTNAYELKAKLLKEQKRYDSAIDCYKQAQKLSEEGDKYELYISMMLDMKGDTQKAIKKLDKVMKSSKKDPKAWREYGVVFSNEGALNLAEYAIRKAISLDPKEATYVHDLAMVFKRQLDIKSALDFVESKLDIFSESSIVLRIYADLQLLSENYEIAEKYAKRAIEHKPDDPTLFIMLGDIQLRQNNDVGLKQLEKAIKMSKDPMIHVRAGAIFAMHCQFDHAKAAYSSALNIIPNFPPALNGLKQLEKIGSKKVSLQKLHEQFEKQMSAIMSDDYEASPDGEILKFNLSDALVDDSDE
ncbi:MAG: hypothetical protein BAJATHORv1_10406 [Candidatus Thorarchaeota archaeon]|nr:MAG: hypothetical protein BAJATHORv1_10406 [Candidatus Thorarchaeota archaeon]